MRMLMMVMVMFEKNKKNVKHSVSGNVTLSYIKKQHRDSRIVVYVGGGLYIICMYSHSSRNS